MVDGGLTDCGNIPPWPLLADLPAVPGQAPAQTGYEAIPPEMFAYAVAAELQLPEPEIQIGPEPSLLKENMAVVGYPYWLWATGVGEMSASESSGPLTVTLRAEATRVTFKTDGQSVSCSGAGTPYRKSTKPATPSPDCGLIFETRGEKEIVATVQWRIRWAVAGQSGTFDMQRNAARDVKVGELQALNKRPR